MYDQFWNILGVQSKVRCQKFCPFHLCCSLWNVVSVSHALTVVKFNFHFVIECLYCSFYAPILKATHASPWMLLNVSSITQNCSAENKIQKKILICCHLLKPINSCVYFFLLFLFNSSARQMQTPGFQIPALFNDELHKFGKICISQDLLFLKKTRFYCFVSL
jgi:hypothetical protein